MMFKIFCCRNSFEELKFISTKIENRFIAIIRVHNANNEILYVTECCHYFVNILLIA